MMVTMRAITFTCKTPTYQSNRTGLFVTAHNFSILPSQERSVLIEDGNTFQKKCIDVFASDDGIVHESPTAKSIPRHSAGIRDRYLVNLVKY